MPDPEPEHIWSDPRTDQACTHGLSFDPVEAGGLCPAEVRERWPRLFGNCPRGCGFHGIAYASVEHLLAGDW